MADPAFAYIWKYRIKPERRSDFLLAYRPGGEWTNLFGKDADYVRTELLQDSADKDVFMTIDYWASRSARDAFMARFSQEFASLDRQCEAFTVDEVHVGDFDINDSAT